MKTYRMVCCDIDGTLFRKDYTISVDTKEAIQQLTYNDIPFVLASGRSYEGVQMAWRQLEMSGYSVCYNGNLVFDGNQVIYDHGFYAYEFEEFLAVLSDFHIEGFLCTKDCDYIAESLYQTILADSSEWVRSPVILNDNQYLCLSEVRDMFYKISLHIEDDMLVQRLIKATKHLPVTLVKAETGYYDIMMQGHQKGDGVKFLSQYLQIPLESIMCIGDNENDISMISYAGLGIAMGNAHESVKKHADFITETNENDGVAKAIHTFIL